MAAPHKGVDTITISEIISRLDTLRPNRFSDEIKIAWLSELDGRLHSRLLSRFENCPAAPETYSDHSQQLLIPQPYGSDIYCFYLQSCMDRENGETGRYNQSAALYNAALDSYRAHCLQTMTAKSAGPFKLKGDAPCPLSPF